MLIELGAMPAVPLSPERKESKEMLTIIEGPDGLTTVRINYSSLSLIQSCARKSYYSLFRGLKAKQESTALLFGTAIHKALEVYYLLPRGERKVPQGFAALADLMPFQDKESWPEGPLFSVIAAFIEAAQPLRLLPDTDSRSISSGVYLLNNYFKTWGSDPWVIFSDEHGPVVERRAELEIYRECDEAGKPTLIIILHGTIDVILRNEQTEVILPADHKTSSRVGNDFYNRLKPNPQYSGYFLLAKEVLGIEGSGFLVNCLQTKARPLTARGGPPNFPRQVTTRSDFDLQEFKEQVVEETKKYLSWRKRNVWPLGPVSSCTEWSGCEYREICAAEPEIRETMLENKFDKPQSKIETENK